jgi:hypothetical protein
MANISDTSVAFDFLITIEKGDSGKSGLIFQYNRRLLGMAWLFLYQIGRTLIQVA